MTASSRPILDAANAWPLSTGSVTVSCHDKQIPHKSTTKLIKRSWVNLPSSGGES